MSTYNLAYMAYQQQVHQICVVIALVAISQVIGWRIGPRLIGTWSEARGPYFGLCAVVYFILAAFTLGAK